MDTPSPDIAKSIRRGPLCPYCNKSMMLNEANSNSYAEQYVCGCQGFLYHLNIHKGQRNR